MGNSKNDLRVQALDITGGFTYSASTDTTSYTFIKEFGLFDATSTTINYTKTTITVDNGLITSFTDVSTSITST